MATFVSNHNIDVKFVKCPYNSNHLVPSHRLSKHIAKCQSMTQNAQQWVMCPFNANHRMTAKQLEEHMLFCKDKSAILFHAVKQSNNYP